MKLLISIVPKELHDDVVKIIGESIIDYQTSIPAKGTAPLEILEYFSIGESERDVILSIIDDQDTQIIFNRLKEELDFLESGRGVAFTASIDALTKLGYKYLYHELTEESSHGKK